MIYEKDINKITIEDIEELIENETPENKYLEYKEYNNNGEKERILKTICGFANSEGGLLIYGLKEKDGFPNEIKGVPLKKSWDKEKQQYLDIIYSNSEPKIYLEIKKIDLENTENKIILFKVPKSWNIPHRVKQGSHKEFYFRRDGRTDPLEFDELKNIFNLSNNLMEKIEGFREKRAFKIYSEKTGSYKLIFHAIPLNAFSGKQYDLSKIEQELFNLENIGKSFFNPNFEGLYSKNDYILKQLYRNGIFEKVYYALENDKLIKLPSTKENIIKFIKDIYKLYEKMNISSPIIFFITYTNIKGCDQHTKFFRNPHEIFDKNREFLPSAVLYLEQYDEDLINKKVDDALIPFWNHFGYEREPENDFEYL